MQNAVHYDFMVRQLRHFFQKKGFIEVPTQTRTSILAACEDPKTITEYSLGGITYPLPQTGQMWLEFELLKNPHLAGVFCVSASYRDEPNPIEGRHHRLFPMFEFEGRGSFEDLQQIEAELLIHMGFEAPLSFEYEELCNRYDTKILEADHEHMMSKEISTVISLEKFPSRTHPFWNMLYAGNGIYNKIDIILHGMETIGSASRSCNKEEMYSSFHTVSNGEYAQLLFNKFGKERVEKELEEYLALDFFPRFGGGIGLTRLERAFILEKLFSVELPYNPVYQYNTQPKPLII